MTPACVDLDTIENQWPNGLVSNKPGGARLASKHAPAVIVDRFEDGQPFLSMRLCRVGLFAGVVGRCVPCWRGEIAGIVIKARPRPDESARAAPKAPRAPPFRMDHLVAFARRFNEGGEKSLCQIN